LTEAVLYGLRFFVYYFWEPLSPIRPAPRRDSFDIPHEKTQTGRKG